MYMQAATVRMIFNSRFKLDSITSTLVTYVLYYSQWSDQFWQCLSVWLVLLAWMISSSFLLRSVDVIIIDVYCAKIIECIVKLQYLHMSVLYQTTNLNQTPEIFVSSLLVKHFHYHQTTVCLLPQFPRHAFIAYDQHIQQDYVLACSSWTFILQSVAQNISGRKCENNYIFKQQTEEAGL